MLYKFRSKAAGDVLMLGPQGDQFLRALGREPSARGILEPPVMPAALQALQQAIDEDERARAAVQNRGRASDDGEGEDAAPAQSAGRDALPLRRRLWPMVEMIRRAQAADEPIVWGV
jgi:hypothetical protein